MSPRHYLDYASSAPLRPEAAQAIVEYASHALHADPGRPYQEGRLASALIEQARTELASMLEVSERQVIFTSSGTEAANFAIATARLDRPELPVVSSGVEHAAVRLTAEKTGPVIDLHVGADGTIDLEHLRSVLGQPVALVNCQFANHEVGTCQPVADVIALSHDAGVPVHVDACAAIGQLPVDLGALGADYVSLSGHKFGAPPGIGALVIGRAKRVRPVMHGGDQERARRAGFENALGIVGLGATARALRAADLAQLAARAGAFRDRLAEAVCSIEGVTVFGNLAQRVPHILCCGIDGVEAEGIVLGLDQAGIAVHSGSSCSSEAFEPSPVLQAMGVDAEHSLRVSVGWQTDDGDVAAFAEQFPKVVAALRALR
jgi:cysteine desulfurase